LGRTLRKVVVDTYALIAKATGEITERADRCLKDIREGRILGVIHPLIIYEILLPSGDPDLKSVAKEENVKVIW